MVAAGALGSPRVYFRGLADARGLIPPLSFILLTQLIYSLAQWSSAGFQRLGQLPLSLVWGVAQAVFMAVVIHLVASRIMKSPLRLEQALRAFAYSGAVWALAFLAQFLPGAYSAVFLAVMLGLHFYLMMVGLVELGDMSMPLAAACQIIAMVVLFLVMVLINQLGNPAPA
ncbi:hypothetical protein AAU61_12905 [Desulfocarbo indianensis]|nr:hypothetical protein AAU61_12905 [Desulfocarbo indianensis]